MSEFYPDDEESRVSFWLRQIEYAEKKFKTYWDLGDLVSSMYENSPASGREADLENGTFDSVPTRTKANFVGIWPSLTAMCSR